MRRELIANVITFIVVLAVGLGTLLFGYMGLRPGTEYTTVTLQLPRSAQLVTGSSVLLRGVRIGEVERVDGDTAGVSVRLKYPRSEQVPADSAVTIEQLSALGEPYVAFSPRGTDGPFLSSGTVLDSTRVSVPTSIAEVFRSFAEVNKLTDAGPLSTLMTTIWQATNGTDQAMPALTQAGELLTSTIVSRLPQIRKMFEQTQIYSADLDWLNPAITPLGPTFLNTAQVLRDAIDNVLKLVMTLNLPDSLDTTLHPFLRRLQPYLAELVPKVAEILGPSLPIMKALDNTLPVVDISALLAQSLALFGNDGAPRLRITIPIPGSTVPAAPSKPPTITPVPTPTTPR